MKKSVVALPGKAGKRGKADFTKLESDSLLLNVLHEGAISEAELLRGCSRVNIRAILRRHADAVRWGKERRVVVGGMPYYIPILELIEAGVDEAHEYVLNQLHRKYPLATRDEIEEQWELMAGYE